LIGDCCKTIAIPLQFDGGVVANLVNVYAFRAACRAVFRACESNTRDSVVRAWGRRRA
jgi:hypothetical protein